MKFSSRDKGSERILNTSPFVRSLPKEKRLSLLKVLDRALLCQKRGHPTFSRFLDPVSASEFREIIEREDICSLMVFGGAMGCERLMLGFFSEYDEPSEVRFPIDSLEISHSSNKLNHRDFLGSILGTGINRDRVGDIFLFPGKAVVFIESEVAGFVRDSLTTVGSAPVSAAIIKDEFIIAPFTEGEHRGLVLSSLRLDTVASAAFNIPRTKAVKLIESEKAFVNWQSVKSISKSVSEGDIITLRGYGRVKIEAVNGRTKKDNISVTVCVNIGNTI